MTEYKNLDNYKKIIKMDLEDESLLLESEVFLSFRLENKWWLVNLEDISGTSLLNTLTKIGRVNPWFLGISNFRGQVYPVINLQYFITGKEFVINLTKENAILSSPKYGLSFALIIPEMDLMISKSNLKEIEEKDAENKNNWAKKYWKDSENNFYLELDLEKLLRSPEFLNIYENNKVNV